MAVFDTVESNPLIKNIDGELHFFCFGPFSRGQKLTYDQAQRISRFLDFYMVWMTIGLLLWIYFLNFQWTASFLVLALALYWLRMRFFSQNTEFTEVSVNLEEISLKIVEVKTIPMLLLTNVMILALLMWGVFQTINAWPMPLSFLFSDVITLILIFLVFTYTTILLYLKGQSLQKP